MNDRALRSAVVGLGGINGGPSREERWVIIPGSEVMAILCLATDLMDLEARLGRIIVGLTRERKPVTASRVSKICCGSRRTAMDAQGNRSSEWRDISASALRTWRRRSRPN